MKFLGLGWILHRRSLIVCSRPAGQQERSRGRPKSHPPGGGLLRARFPLLCITRNVRLLTKLPSNIAYTKNKTRMTPCLRIKFTSLNRGSVSSSEKGKLGNALRAGSARGCAARDRQRSCVAARQPAKACARGHGAEMGRCTRVGIAVMSVSGSERCTRLRGGKVQKCA